MKNQRGEISVAVILLLTFLSGLGVTIVGVNYDHALRREEAEKARAKMQVESGVDFSSGKYELEEVR